MTTAPGGRREVRAGILAGTLTLLALLPSACDDGRQTAASSAQNPPPAVVVANVVRKDVTPGRTFVGRVEAIDSVMLRARVEGFLERREFVEGRDVKAGDLLFQIEQAPYEAEVQGRQADLASAEATKKNATLALARARKLLKRGNISQANVDAADAEEARSDAAVLQAKAALKQAEINLGYTQIHAPISGRIGRANFSTGNLVGPSTGGLADLVSLDPIYVKFSVSGRDLLESRRQRLAGQGKRRTAFLRLDDGTRYGHAGKFTFVDNRVDPQTDTVTVRAEFANSDKLLLPDQFVTVIVERSEPISALIVPQAAIQEDQTGRFVLIVDKDNRVQVRRVTLGDQEGTDWIVESGVEEGERVIVQGLQKVQPGVAVKPVSAGQAGEGGKPARDRDGPPDKDKVTKGGQG